MPQKKALSNDFDEIADRHVLQILSTATKSGKRNLEALFELGDLLTQQGHIEDGLRIDLRLAELLPNDPTVHYNLACSYSLMDMKEKALAELNRAIQFGYVDAAHMEQDTDLDALHEDPRFHECLQRIVGKG